MFGVPVLIVAALFGLGVYGLVNQQAAVATLGFALGGLGALALIAYFVVLSIAFTLALRLVVLELTGPIEGLRRALRLMRRRAGRVALLWLLSLAVGFAIGIGFLIGFLFLFVAGAALTAIGVVVGHLAGGLIVGIPVGVLLVALLIVVGSAIAAFNSTFWTLAFRRLDLERPQPGALPSASGPPAPA
jgi:hypothetical protein